VTALVLALRRECLSCGAIHYATQCHVCKAPAVSAEERAELFAVYAGLKYADRPSFETFLGNKTLLGCLRNVVRARKRALAEQRAADPASFELTA
jgi:hypothetical protein